MCSVESLLKFTMDKEGDDGVSDARRTDVLRSGAKFAVLGGLGSERGRLELSRDLNAVISAPSSKISAIIKPEDVGRDPITASGTDIRTHCCLLWPFRAVGLPFIADGLPGCIEDESHWNGFPLLLLVDDTPVDFGEPEDCGRRADNLLGDPPGVTVFGN